ncbi:MAG: NAD-dependent epimerase/dehydratase family protein [Roseburia sp.]|nr:NAD-dependent epimerase/dehydratase family protein [Roseburia sp.]
MKSILLTGLHSYIGDSVEAYLQEYHKKPGKEVYRTEKISLRGEEWKQADFGRFDAILHVAGLAHADVGRVSEEEKKRYYETNCDLAEEAARKAKADGAGQFIYMSSVIVYGDSAKVGGTKHITGDTLPAPADFYGDSKWQAEQRLTQLASEDFSVAIVRTPMVYGRGSRGNYPLLCKLADKMPVFPKVGNARSMIYIENLAEFLRLLVESGEGGIFWPQNREYTDTGVMVKLIRESRGKKMRLWSIGRPFVYLASRLPGKPGKLVNKAFGSLTIEQELSNRRITGYQLYSLEESIRRTHEG